MIQEEVQSSDEDEVNIKRTGLPQIKKFYRKMNELDKRLQMS